MTPHQIQQEEAEHRDLLQRSYDVSHGRVVMGDLESRESDYEAFEPVGKRPSRTTVSPAIRADMNRRIREMAKLAVKLGVTGDDNHRGGRSDRTKLRLVSTGQTFIGFHAASEYLGVSRMTICRMLAGKRVRCMAVRGIALEKVA